MLSLHALTCRAEQPEALKQEKHIPADPNSARSRKLAAKKAKAKEVRNAKKLSAKARKQRAAERAQQQGGESHPSLAPQSHHKGLSLFVGALPICYDHQLCPGFVRSFGKAVQLDAAPAVCRSLRPFV